MSYSIHRITTYSDDIAAQFGALAPQLTSSADGTPLDRQRLEMIINSPFHDQFIVTSEEGEVVGTAAVSLVLGAITGRITMLHDFVVDTRARGTGAADELWRSVCQWALEHDADKLEFTSSAKREAAHRFYKKHGAQVRDTILFVIPRHELEHFA